MIAAALAANPQAGHKQVQVTLDIDSEHPQQAIYKVTVTQEYTLHVAKCPDCGVDLF
mgnify:FL=1